MMKYMYAYHKYIVKSISRKLLPWFNISCMYLSCKSPDCDSSSSLFRIKMLTHIGPEPSGTGTVPERDYKVPDTALFHPLCASTIVSTYPAFYSCKMSWYNSFKAFFSMLTHPSLCRDLVE